jgi:hypothetical protein
MATRNRESTVHIGAMYEHRYKGTLFHMEVVQAENGVAYRVEGIGVYRSPTAAAKAIVGDQFINGRKFWKIDG